MSIEIQMLVPARIKVVSPEFSNDGDNRFTASYELEPGFTRQIDIALR